jgi:hypothetical protein
VFVLIIHNDYIKLKCVYIDYRDFQVREKRCRKRKVMWERYVIDSKTNVKDKCMVERCEGIIEWRERDRETAREKDRAKQKETWDKQNEKKTLRWERNNNINIGRLRRIVKKDYNNFSHIIATYFFQFIRRENVALLKFL